MNKTIDYQNFCPIDTPLEKRRALNVGDIFSNTIRCKNCNDIIRSKNRHDFVSCKCGKVSVDGGSWYSKISGDLSSIELMIVPYTCTKDSE